MVIYSHTSLSSFENCPRQFYYKYVAKVPVPEPTESISLFLGRRVHEILEHLYRQHMNGVMTPQSDLLEYFAKRWDDAWSDEIDLHGEGTPEGWKRIGAKCIEDYCDRHEPFDDSRTVQLEQQVQLSLDTDDRYRVVGYIDRLAMRGDGTWEIHDYKTDKRLATQMAKDTDRQLALYEISLRQMWPDIVMVELA